MNSTLPLQAASGNQIVYNGGPVMTNGVLVCALRPHAGQHGKPVQCMDPSSSHACATVAWNGREYGVYDGVDIHQCSLSAC